MDKLRFLLQSVIDGGGAKSFRGMTLNNINTLYDKRGLTIRNFLANFLNYQLPESFIVVHKDMDFSYVPDVNENGKNLCPSNMLLSLELAKLFMNGFIFNVKRLKNFVHPFVIFCDGQSNDTNTFFLIIKALHDESRGFTVEEVVCSTQHSNIDKMVKQNLSYVLNSRYWQQNYMNSSVKSKSLSKFLIADYCCSNATSSLDSSISNPSSNSSRKFIEIEIASSKVKINFM